jgi:hypothetical protein
VCCPAALLLFAPKVAVLVPPVAVKLVQVDVRQQRRTDRPLWYTQFGVSKESPFHQTRFEKAGNEAKKTPISNALCQAVQQDVMPHVVERAFDVGKLIEGLTNFALKDGNLH